MDYNLIYKKAESYVIGLFEKMQNEKLVYHNLQHTKTVVERTKEIAAHYNLSERNMLVLYVASWFHDTGHLFTPGFKGHEEKSVDVMRKFMNDYTSDAELQNEIEACILAPKMPRNPGNLLQEILCDADTYHFGTKEFKETNKKMREEYSLREEKTDRQEWDENKL